MQVKDKKLMRGELLTTKPTDFISYHHKTNMEYGITI